ncbi:sugar ABC transporter substrate-binding protein [Microtetraspora sp. AC03309]|uniref:ABC transporter substrate-binding protein n=1 Tax=Microtetraspora sp. AC03309 TaxID=2779376 RepID=UPI001E4A8424|nr:sugar ABC transporter substrate-binding protein [Microtetraspora sp. AC03309]MCC5578351.1 sugar ABC transporter substrate-binding protein [Microtetraspora sp. AC03309]
MRRYLRLAAAAAVFSLTVTACGSSGGDEAPAADGGGLGTAQNPVSIRVLANDAFAKQWQDQLVPEFNKKYPNIKVTVDGVPYNDQLAKSMLELTSPTATYDIVLGDDPWMPQLAKTGGLVDLKTDLTKFADANYDWDDINSAALAAGEWDGHQYGVPVRSNLLLMFYNRSLYKKAKVDEPTTATTWDQYFEDAAKLVQDTDGDGKTDAWAVGTYFTKDPLTPTIWQTALNSNGGKLLDENLKVQFDNETGVKALQTQVDMLKYAPPGAATYQFNEPLEAFRQGKVATMFMWGSVYKGTAVDTTTTTLKEDEVGITTLPAGSTGPGAHRGIWTAGVAKKSTHQAAAWTFLQWTTSKEGEQWIGANLGTFPARNSTLNGTPPAPWLKPVYTAISAGYDAIAKGEMWRPRLPESDAVQQILALQTSRAISGQATAQEAVHQAATDISALLKSKGYQQ